MKKNYFTWQGKMATRTICYLLLSFLFTIILFYSCRKIDKVYNSAMAKTFDPAAVITKNDFLNWYDALPAPEHNPVRSQEGLSNGNGKLPFALKWDQAQQRIINGKHVVKVPVAYNSFMMFIKDGPNKPLSVYAYKILNGKKSNGPFTGVITSFSFQDFKLRGEAVVKGKPGKVMIIPIGEKINATQVMQLKSEYAENGKAKGLRTNKLKTNSWLGELIGALGQTLEGIGCELTGGNWENPLPDGIIPPFSGLETKCQGGIFGSSGDSGGTDIDPYSEEISANFSDDGNFATVNFTLSIGGSSTGGSSSGGSSSGGSSSGGSSSGGGLTWAGGDLSSLVWGTFSANNPGYFPVYGGSGSSPLVKVETDTIRLTYPCVANIIDNLKNNDSTYKSFVHGFLGNGVPTMHWKAQNLAWDPTGSLGTGSFFGQTTAYTTLASTDNVLNSNMLQHSSKLLVVATIIHESIHSAVHYYYVNGLLGPDTTANRPIWISRMRAYINLSYWSADYVTHSTMMVNYFTGMVNVLKHAVPGHTDKEYAEALLVGANNPGNTATVTTAQRNEIQADYNRLKTAYSITDTDMTNFINSNMVLATPPNLCL